MYLISPEPDQELKLGDNRYLPFLTTTLSMDKLQQSFTKYGFAVFGPPALELSIFEVLCAEAKHQRQIASWPLNKRNGRSRVSEDTVRGQLGTTTKTLLLNEATRNIMSTITEQEIIPSWSASCYTYYHSLGSYLGRHCDKPDTCSLVMLIGLESNWPAGNPPPPGNQLKVYKNINATNVAYKITTLANRITILDGKRLPHERSPLGMGQKVTILSACFKLKQ